ncbi:septum site-determining protein Ssd [uncultured Mycolicibacterium sp.]|uniref:septum site-determining protein Ssd n=1 Tax=uncultured Mycolicibacterium sp. TaxID=2320817 RepID=UPI0026187527|nr:septum site-determining protein Ssd [uncultured Mycolicibacterium sp.]
MTTTAAVLVLLDDPVLRDDVDRVAAAAGVPVVHAAEPPGRRAWTAASAVLLDAACVHRGALGAPPRRDRVLLVGRAEPDAAAYRAALAAGAERVLTLPRDDAELVALLSAAAEDRAGAARRGAVLAVVAGRGGAGASVFAAALALCARAEPLLVDVDPCSGGIDLLLGAEAAPGLRWPDLAVRDGRLAHTALRDALPRHGAVSVLSSGREPAEIGPAALGAVLEAGYRAGTTVVCDVPRRGTAAAETAVQAADLVVVVTTADVRSAAATAAVGAWCTAANPNVGVVVRGPAPGGMRAADVAAAAGLPLLAAMRPQPGLDVALERGGLRLGRRGPLAGAARRVLALLGSQPAVAA